MDMSKMQQLEAVVGEVDASGPPTEAQQQEQQQQEAAATGAQEWGAVMQMIGGGLSMLAPELGEVYTEDACGRWGLAMQAVADKYGWNGPSGIPEFALVMTTAPLAVPSYLILREKVRQIREARALAEAQARGRGGAPAVEKVAADGG